MGDIFVIDGAAQATEMEEKLNSKNRTMARTITTLAVFIFRSLFAITFGVRRETLDNADTPGTEWVGGEEASAAVGWVRLSN